jgi:hypothetical protein
MKIDNDRRAVAFFWCMLIAATGVSVTGNIANALLSQPDHAQIAARGFFAVLSGLVSFA